MTIEPFIPHGSSVSVQFAFWLATSLATFMVGYVIYLKRENGKIKKEQSDEAVTRIEKSIENLGKAIAESNDRNSKAIAESNDRNSQALHEVTMEFKVTSERIWEHIGNIDGKVDTLRGEHNALTGGGKHTCQSK